MTYLEKLGQIIIVLLFYFCISSTTFPGFIFTSAYLYLFYECSLIGPNHNLRVLLAYLIISLH